MGNYAIIGGSSGIGKQLVIQLSEAGHQLFATYNNHPPEMPLQNTQWHQLNVLDEVLDTNFMPTHLDGLVYCPGAIQLKPFARISASDFLKDYQHQVLGAVQIIQQLLPKLKQSTQASIVLFSTVAVQAGMPYHSLVASSKGAIEGLTRALAAEFAPQIRVNCIAPSLTDTPLSAGLLNTDQKRIAGDQRHPLRRIGNPSDIANMAEFLLSPKSSWITGQILHIDGGLSTLKL